MPRLLRIHFAEGVSAHQRELAEAPGLVLLWGTLLSSVYVLKLIGAHSAVEHIY